MPETKEFTIHDTIRYKVGVDDKEILMEGWIVDDEVFSLPCFSTPAGAPTLALARLLTPWVIKELGLENAVKYKEAKGVAMIRKSVADIASDYDLENLLTHEAAHAYLGHEAVEAGQPMDWATQEKQVRDLIGEAEVANDLFGVRYMAIRGIDIKKCQR